MMQLKLPWTLITSVIILRKHFTSTQITNVLFISICCTNIVSKNDIQSFRATDPLAILAMVVETLMSSLVGVYMQRVFADSRNSIWIRNAELAILSIPIYGGIIWHIECDFIPTSMGIVFSCFAAGGGILVAFTIVYCGALSKTIATSFSIIVVTVVEHILYSTIPGINSVSFYAICTLSIINYSGILEYCRETDDDDDEKTALTKITAH
jgi:hypothetical protein